LHGFRRPLAEGGGPRHIPRMDVAIAIRVNGEERRVSAATVAELLAGLGLPAQKVAVERNLEIVPRSLYGATRLAEGDAIEIVHFIGGG
jgi:thiamine biosynthesis protein ThiS